MPTALSLSSCSRLNSHCFASQLGSIQHLHASCHKQMPSFVQDPHCTGDNDCTKLGRMESSRFWHSSIHLAHLFRSSEGIWGKTTLLAKIGKQRYELRIVEHKCKLFHTFASCVLKIANQYMGIFGTWF